METKNNGKSGGSAFFWGLIIGGLLATLLTTKRGRQILRELTNLGLELFEDFVEERTKQNHESRIMNQEESDEEVARDIESEITEVEEQPTENGHTKKRLFKGIKRK